MFFPTNSSAGSDRLNSFHLLQFLPNRFVRKWQISAIADDCLLAFAAHYVAQELFYFRIDRHARRAIDDGGNDPREWILSLDQVLFRGLIVRPTFLNTEGDRFHAGVRVTQIRNRNAVAILR